MLHLLPSTSLHIAPIRTPPRPSKISNVPSACRNNVEGVLHRDNLSYFNALLLATGVNRPIFAAGQAALGGAGWCGCGVRRGAI